MKYVLDLSRHNGTIDFAKVREAGFSDVILQLGWIGNYKNHTLDTKFNEYFREAKRYGFNVGIYVFTYCKSVSAIENGAKWVINQLTNKTIELPIFLDVENDESSNSIISNLGKAELTSHCLTFCNLIKNAGYQAGVYANKNFFENYIDHKRLVDEDYTIWWAEYNGKSNPYNSYKIDLWQYTSSGKVNGIQGNVDISKTINDFGENKNTNTNQNNKKDGEYEMKRYVNGSTKEIVYQDLNCSKQIGYLNPREEATCYGQIGERALIVYKVDGQENYKTGFVKWLGGIRNE